jgi:hypothetical protein
MSDITDSIRMRAGDRYPTIAGIIEDEDGTAVNLTDGATVATVTLTITGHAPGVGRIEYEVPAQVVDAASGTVQYDWQDGDTDSTLRPAVFTVTALVVWSDGSRLTAPTLQPVEVNLRPGVADGNGIGVDLLLGESSTDVLLIDSTNAFLI